jgi:hypothetical protein
LAVSTTDLWWFAILVVTVSFIELPDGNGFTKILQVPGSLLMTAFLVWLTIRGAARLRSAFEQHSSRFIRHQQVDTGRSRRDSKTSRLPRAVATAGRVKIGGVRRP